MTNIDINANYISLVVVLAYQLLETGSWLCNKTSINFQVLSSMDLRWVWNDHREMLFIVPGFFSLMTLLSYIETKFRHCGLIKVNTNLYTLIIIFIIVLFYDFTNNVYHSLYPFSNLANPISDDKSKIKRYFKSNAEIIKIPYKRMRKNIILFQLESLEKQSMGKYNKYYPHLMPYLSNLSEKGTFFTNMISQAYTTWTSGSIFASHCGLPHVVTDMTWGVLKWTTQTSDWPNVTCFPDYLHMAGYNQYAVASGGLGIMGIRDFFKKHHMKIYDNSVHNKRRDWDTTNYLISDIFPMLEKSQPFYLFITNDDTHPFFFVDRRCKKRIGASKMLNSFDCFDQIFERFMKAYENTTFFKNTIFIVLGDHLMIGDFNDVYENPRKLLMFMPYDEKRKIKKQTTLYDVAPTILDMLGIKYWPAFPFGKNLFSEEVGSFPGKEDFATIYEIMHNTINRKSSKIKCFGKDGFCDDPDSYIRNRKHLLRMKR